MGEERVFIWVLGLMLCGCLGNAQNSSFLNLYAGLFQTAQAPVAAPQSYAQAPVAAPQSYAQAPVAAPQSYAQAPVAAPQSYAQAPVAAPQSYAQAPVAAPQSYAQAPVAAPQAFTRPAYTQAPVTPRPTIKGPTVSAVPVDPPTPNPDAVKVYCGESSVQLEVDMDLLGTGHLIQSSDITLGGCGPVEQKGSTPVLLFVTELHGCGSVLAMTEDSLVYTFALNYQPRAIGATPIIRTSDAVVGIQCHYLRLHNVSSNALNPTWIPYYSTLSAEQLLIFSLRIMDDNWQMERASNVFFLGDLIKIEASVVQANHVPLRVFVDTCVATLVPEMNAVPSYPFIENQGCLMDSKLTNSRSQFLSRVQDDKLQFELDAFRFAQDARSAIYIFCHLRATPVQASEGKACSFPLGQQRWIEASGNDGACSSCGSSLSGRKGRSVASAVQYEGDAVIGPIVVQEADVPVAHGSLRVLPQANGSFEVVVMAGVMAVVGLVCIIVLVWRRYKPVL